MYFDLSEDHELLRDSVRGALGRSDPVAALHGATAPAPEARRMQAAIDAAQGWTGLMLADALGGGDVSAVEAAIIAEEFGRALHCGDFAGQSAAAQIVQSRGTGDIANGLLRGIIRGTHSIAWAACDVDQRTGGLRTSVNAVDKGANWTLHGRAGLVQDADLADFILVDACHAGGLVQFLVPRSLSGLTIAPADIVDVGRSFFDVTFNQAVVDAGALLGKGEAAPAIEAGLALAAMLVSADSVGAGARALEKTVAYAKDRVAFGQPIGSFQAIKHRCARMLVLIETARAAVWKAAIALRDDPASAGEAVSAAKSYANNAALQVAGDALQLHGGIGMTWELDIHILLKRIKTNSVRWGTSAGHRERVAIALRL